MNLTTWCSTRTAKPSGRTASKRGRSCLAFGLAGVNLHTWTGFGSVTYWNAYVAATEMHGSGTFFDARFTDRERYPVAAQSHTPETREERPTW